MTDWHTLGRLKITHRAWRGVVIFSVLTLFTLAFYPDPVEATIIEASSRQAPLNAPDPFQFRLALSRENSNAGACSLASLNADASFYTGSRESKREYAEYQAGTNNFTFSPTGQSLRNGASRLRSEPRGGSPNLDRMVWASNDVSPDPRILNDSISDLSRIKSRIASMGNCLVYMQYLLKTVEGIFDIHQRNVRATFDKNFGIGPADFLFMKAGRPAVSSSGSAPGFSKFLPRPKKLGPRITLLNAQQSKLTRNSNARKGSSIAKRQKSSPAQAEKIQIKEFVIYIFSKPYTYILIFVVLIFSIFINKMSVKES